MKPLIFILFFSLANPLHYTNTVTFKRDLNDNWECTTKGWPTANYLNIWLVFRENFDGTQDAGFCYFNYEKTLIKGPIKVKAVYPKPGYIMKQNLFIYQVRKCHKGTCWYVWDDKGNLIYNEH
jgi:hypothetical protein